MERQYREAKDLVTKLVIIGGAFFVLVLTLYGYLSEYNVTGGEGASFSPSPLTQ